MTLPEARDLAVEFACAATNGGPEDWAVGAGRLADFDGRSWLLLDDAARSFTYATGTPVSGTRGWLTTSVTEATGFVATVTSLHTDGRIRQRATKVLAGSAGRPSAAALALRTMDHVPQVREEALRGLLPRLNSDVAETVLAVLLAGCRRQHAHAALDSVRATLLETLPLEELISNLMVSRQRDVRRWAFALAHEYQLLTAERLLTAVQCEPDQWLRATCSQWLLEVASPTDLRTLLRVKSAEGRLVALSRVSDDDLGDEVLLPLLADRSPRVREVARWRARRRGLDVLGWYRRQVAAQSTAANTLAACLDGLAAVGGLEDLNTFKANLHHAGARVRAAAVTGVGAHAGREQALTVLRPLLLDPSPRVSSTAARILGHLGAAPAAAAAGWRSSQPWSRRAAWSLARAGGSWNRIEADLRVANDVDPQLASLGRSSIRNWLEASAATTWAVLEEPQRDRIRQLLDSGVIDETTRRTVAFHAGIRLEPLLSERDAPTDIGKGPDRPVRQWLRILRRR